MNEQFYIKGSSLKSRFWRGIKNLGNSIQKWANKGIKRNEDKTIDVIEVKFPSPFSLLIKYRVTNLDEKYEIIIQGYFQEAYTIFSKEGEIPKSICIPDIIESQHRNAFKLTTKE